MTIDTRSGGISNRCFLGTASAVAAASKKVHYDG